MSILNIDTTFKFSPKGVENAQKGLVGNPYAIFPYLNSHDRWRILEIDTNLVPTDENSALSFITGATKIEHLKTQIVLDIKDFEGRWAWLTDNDYTTFWDVK